MYEKIALTSNGQTGNNTHAGVAVVGYDTVAFQFVVEAVGGTPTITWKVQGSVDDPATVTDVSANWFDVAYVTDATDTTATAARTRTTVGADVEFLANPVARRYRRYRLVTSANTNVTYHAEAHRVS